MARYARARLFHYTLLLRGGCLQRCRKNPSTAGSPGHRACAQWAELPTKTPGKRWTTPSAGSPFSTGPTDATPGPAGKKPLDIHVIYTGGYENSLNSLPNANAGIKVFRKVDFVWGAAPFFDASRQYCDIVLPVATWWEKGNIAWSVNAETVYWADRIMEPLYEARPETEIAEELASRLGLDPKAVNTMTDAERTYYSFAGAIKMTDQATAAYEPLFTITQEDINALGVEGEPQQGSITIAEFKEKGAIRPSDPRGTRSPIGRSRHSSLIR